MEAIEFREWSSAIVPWVAVCATIWVAVRVNHVRFLVNSEMEKFRNVLESRAVEQREAVFHAGQQDNREKNRAIVTAAANATTAAANATTAAAQVITPPAP